MTYHDKQTGEVVDKPIDENLHLWNMLGMTDPEHTKQFQRPGGFKGTAVRPIWNIRKLTAVFGPAGIGWGTEEPEFKIVPADDIGQIAVYCVLKCWYKFNGQRAEVYGIGGDKVVAQDQRGRFVDDEAFKKAFTDALGNAFLRVGLSSDIHMGKFEDSKYIEETREHFHPQPVSARLGPPPRRAARLRSEEERPGGAVYGPDPASDGQLLVRAADAALGGLQSYEMFWKDATIEERKFIGVDRHEYLKKQAMERDAKHAAERNGSRQEAAEA